MSSIKKENLHDRTIKIKKNARTTLAASFYPTVQSWTRVSTMFPLLSLYILKPLLRNVSFKYLKKKKITKWRVKILLCNDFPRNYCIPLHPQLSAIGLFRVSFDRSGQLVDEREREKKGKISPIIVMIMVKMIGENGIRRWLTSWHRYKLMPDENFLLRSHRSIAHASRGYFFTDDPLHRQRSPVFSRGPCGKCKWHTSIAIRLVSLSNASEK